MAAQSGRAAARDAAAAERSAADSLAGQLASASKSEPRLDTSLLLARQAVATSGRPSLQGDLLDLLVRHDVLSSASTGGSVSAREIDSAVNEDGSRAMALMATGAPEEGEDLLLVDPRTAEVVSVLARSHGDYGRLPWPAGFVDHGRTAAFMRDAPRTRPETASSSSPTPAPGPRAAGRNRSPDR